MTIGNMDERKLLIQERMEAMKGKLRFIAVLFVLMFWQVLLTACEAGPPRQWVQSYIHESSPTTGALEEFDGWLYAAYDDYTNAGAVINRSKDGKNWEPASQPAFGQPFQVQNSEDFWSWIWDMIVFEKRLYAGYGSFLCPPNSDWTECQFQSQIWRTANGTDWEAVVPDGWGDPLNGGLSQFAVFDGVLYDSTYPAGGLGERIYRSPDGVDWEQVADADTLDCSVDSDGYRACWVTGLTVFKDRLFVVLRERDESQQDNEGNWGVSQPVRVLSTQDGTSWQTVTGDGFGDPQNVNPGGFVTYKGYLYLGMTHIRNLNDPAYRGVGQLFRTQDGANWQEIEVPQFDEQAFNKVEGGTTFKGLLYMVADHLEGLGVWASADGLNWELVSDQGFGEPVNIASKYSSAITEFKSDLYVGTDTNNGAGQVWRFCKECK
jgi:hypothetical protein